MLAALFALLLGKFIAIHFTPDNFGEYSLISSATALFMGVLATPAIQSFRFGFHSRPYAELLDFYRSLFLWLLMALGLAGFVIAIFSEMPVMIAGIVCLILIFRVNESLHNAAINLLGLHSKYGMLQIILPASNLIFLAIIVYVFKDSSVVSLLLAVLLSELVVLLLSALMIEDHKRVRILSPFKLLKSDWFPTFISYIKPLLVLPVFAWVVNSGDKYLIKIFLDDRHVGLYSAAYSVGSKLFLVGSGILIAYLNASTYSLSKDESNFGLLHKKTTKRLFIYLAAGVLLVFCLFVFSNPLGRLLLSEDYEAGFSLIPVLGAANLVLTSFYFMEQVVYAIGTTNVIVIHYATGAMANVCLNLIFIPALGLKGAALAMVLSGCIQFAVLYYLFRKMLKVQDFA